MKNIIFGQTIATVLFLVALIGQADCFAQTGADNQNTKAISSLKSWLADAKGDWSGIEDQAFSKAALSKTEAESAAKILWEDYAAKIKKERAKEWKAKVIKLKNLEMKFDYRVFGEKPKTGRSLFISMHGGGGAPARVNDQQWRNQIGLYKPAEGIYLAPRAPTNTWNLWHEGHIDDFFHRIIENAIVLEGVNPNRIYIMGYSAGGDGVYQLAPRMADYLAAASMMAGHPNDAQPLGLRNIGFALHMGGNDSAYNRNKVAKTWGDKLDELQKNDPEGYKHQVKIHAGMGHWMKLKDAVAVPWMAKFTREPMAEKIVWQQSGRIHDRFYWLKVDKSDVKKGSIVTATRQDQSVNLEKVSDVKSLKIRLNDEMFDLEKPVKIVMNGKTLSAAKVNRTIGMIQKTIVERGDPNSIFSSEIEVKLAD